jgi:ADP-ribosylglycohydrolase
MPKNSVANRSRKGSQLSDDRRKAAVVSSALWAAAGDALGWITELGREQTVAYRTGSSSVKETVEWRRRIGGRFGPTVRLPAGTYSDDTQLRLSVSRAIRGTGEFDVAAFAKVELPVWLSYSLGAGRGTTAAANNLSKPSATWFSNFFSGKDARGYFDAGGNGAAMRIQPHVWKSKSLRFEEFIADVVRDAITTHGHPIGFCGAAFHAMTLAYALENYEISGPSEWKDLLAKLRKLPQIIKDDEQLGLFWLAPWEERFGTSLHEAIEREVKRATSLLKDLQPILNERDNPYHKLLETLGLFTEATRGSGMDTAIAAAGLALLGSRTSLAEAMCLGANAIGSDTDTITSMAGAILGAAQGGEPTWTIQDRQYIISEAVRMADIAAGEETQSFQYPDLMGWSPPATQGDAVGTTERTLWLAGLGKALAFGEVWTSPDAEWQWLQLEFGQTVLAKRRANPRGLARSDLPAERLRSRSASERRPQDEEPSLFSSDLRLAEVGRQLTDRERSMTATRDGGREKSNTSSNPKQPLQSIDQLTEWIIEENFNPEIIGRAFLQASLGPAAVDRCIALAAIIAKAIDARRKRSAK